MYNVIDVERFKKDFYESIAPIFKEYIESTFLQKSIYKGHILNLRNGKCKSNGGLNSPFLRIIKNKMGSLSAKGGLYFEKRLKIVDSILIDNLNLDTFACIKQGDKVFRKKFVVPKGTDSLIVKYSKKLWRKEANFENFEYYLKNIFDYMLEHCGEEEVVVHDIDQILMTKTGKIFVLELKTKQRAQDFNAYMDVAKLIETWACLTYQLIKDNIDMVDFRNSDISNVKNLVSWNNISILYLMNDLRQSEIKNVKYFPIFNEEYYEKGGVIGVDTFYKFFYGIDLNYIVEVEDDISINYLTPFSFETILYVGFSLYEMGLFPDYSTLIEKYYFKCK